MPKNCGKNERLTVRLSQQTDHFSKEYIFRNIIVYIHHYIINGTESFTMINRLLAIFYPPRTLH